MDSHYVEGIRRREVDDGVSAATRAELIDKVLPIEKRLFALGERYLDAANADVRNLATAFFVHNPHFFTFVHEDGVSPTNNAAERALRTAVAWGSLCVLSFEGWKHWRSRIAMSLPRTSCRVATRDGGSDRVALEIRTAGLLL